MASRLNDEWQCRPRQHAAIDPGAAGRRDIEQSVPVQRSTAFAQRARDVEGQPPAIGPGDGEAAKRGDARPKRPLTNEQRARRPSAIVPDPTQLAPFALDERDDVISRRGSGER